MKWGHRKASYNYGSIGSNISARIRKKQLSDTRSRISSDSKSIKSMTKNYEWMKKNNSDIKKSGSKIGNSKLLTGIRNNRMKKLKNKINTLKDSVKEDNEIIKELSGYETTARKRAQNINRTKKAMVNAKKAKKLANKTYEKAYDEYSKGPIIGITKKQREKNSKLYKNMYDTAVKATEADNNYKNAKRAYRNSKR